MQGTVVSVLTADARSVTVRVELANPEGSGNDLQDRSLATIIIDPQAAVQPTAPVPQANGIVPAREPTQQTNGIVQASYESKLPMNPSSKQGGLVLPPTTRPQSATLPVTKSKK